MNKKAKTDGKRAEANSPSTSPIGTTPQGQRSALRELSVEEMKQAYHVASTTGKLHGPIDLRRRWATLKKQGQAGDIKELVEMLQRESFSPEMNDPAEAPARLAGLVEALVIRFERLVESGTLDSVLPNMSGLPLLYSPKAGTGASDWESALRLFESKKVAKNAVAECRGRDSEAARDPRWGLLAESAVDCALHTSAYLPEFLTLREHAVAVGCLTKGREKTRKHVWRCSLYLLDDGGVLTWPDWMELCRDLPERVQDNVPGYQKACKAIAEAFFNDPCNKWADQLLSNRIRAREMTWSRARKEAVAAIVGAVARLGGEKG